ncbi:MAG: DUF1273 family protein [Clostridia bacterium]|nr:DUF1273 family protein [Clostridia bacterium]
MKDLIFNKAKTACFTGHRVLDNNFNKEQLKEVVLGAINRGYNTFLIGLALGFDTACFDVLEELKTQFNISIIGCIPCPEQPASFSVEEREKYYKMIENCTETIILSEKYTKYCMQKRNRYMVDNSSLVIAYLKRDFGGTFFTVNYAKKNKIEIKYL